MRIYSNIKMRLPWSLGQGLFIVSRHSSRSGNPGAPPRYSSRSGNPGAPPRYSRRNGNPGPDYSPARSWQQIFGGWTAASHPALSLQHNLYYSENSPFSPSCVAPAGHPVILVATGIQGPDYAPARSWQQIFGGRTAASHPALSLQHNLYYYENSPFSSSCVAPAGHPSFSSQRESRALTIRRHGHGTKYSADGRRHRTLPFPFSTTFITMKIVHFHLHVWPQRAPPRHSRRNGNPGP